MSQQSFSCRDFAIADIDGDKRDDLLIVAEPGDDAPPPLILFTVDEFASRAVWVSRFGTREIRDVGAIDLDHDGCAEPIVALMDVGQPCLEVLVPRTGNTLFSSSPMVTRDADGDGRWDGEVRVRGAVDLDGDGTDEILLSLGAGLDLRPRELLAVSANTGQVRARLPTGGPPARLALSRNPLTGAARVILSTAAVANQWSEGPFSDDRVFLSVTDESLKPLWWVELCPWQREASWALMPSTDGGRDRIVMSRVLVGATSESENLLEIRDLETGDVMASRSLACEVPTLLVTAAPGPGGRIILGGLDGVLRSLDRGLREIASYQGTSLTTPLCIADLSGDGHDDVVALGGIGEIRIFTADLEPIAYREFPAGVTGAAVMSLAGSSRLLVQSGDLQVLGMAALPASATDTPPRWIPLLTSVAAAILLLSGAIWSRVVIRRTRASVAWDRLTEELVSLGHLRWECNLGDLIRLTAPYRGGGPELAEFLARRLAEELTHLRAATLPKLDDIASQALLLPETRANGRSIRRAIAGARGLTTASDPGRVRQAVTALQAAMHELEAVLHDRRTCDPCHAVRIAVNGSRNALERAETVVRLEVPAPNGRRVWSLEHELVTILRDLIANALTAMGPVRERCLVIRSRDSASSFIIELLDNGIGLPDIPTQELLELGRSTKPGGGGFGLAYAKRRLAIFHGSVSLRKAEAPFATCAEITLRRAFRNSTTPDGGSSRRE